MDPDWRGRRRISRSRETSWERRRTCLRSRRAACRSMREPSLFARRRAYEMVAGRQPFGGQTTSDVIAAILEAITSRAAVAPEVPSELVRIVGKALRKDPGQRYQVMKDLQLDLEALRDETATRATAGSRNDEPAPEPASRPRRAAMLAAFAALVLAVGASGWWYRQRASPAPPPSGASATPVARPLTRLTFDEGLQTDATFSPDGRSIAYASDRAGNFDIWVQPSTAANRANSPTRRRRRRSPPGRRMGKRLCSAPNAIAVDCSSPMPTEARSVSFRHLASTRSGLQTDRKSCLVRGTPSYSQAYMRWLPMAGRRRASCSGNSCVGVVGFGSPRIPMGVSRYPASMLNRDSASIRHRGMANGSPPRSLTRRCHFSGSSRGRAYGDFSGTGPARRFSLR